MKLFVRLAIPLALCVMLAGCPKNQIHPGTANAFDSNVYDTLLTADNVIQTTKSDLAANKFPASIAGNVKTALNLLITAYDAADTFYCGAPVGTQCAASSYHSLVMAGSATASETQQMTSLQSSVNTATTNLTAAKGGTQ